MGMMALLVRGPACRREHSIFPTYRVGHPTPRRAPVIDRDRLAALLERERASFAERHPRSLAAYRAAGGHLLGGVPMAWRSKAAGRFPLSLAEAKGATVVDIDGHRYVDLCLGDTAAMAGHSPAAPGARARARLRAGRGGT